VKSCCADADTQLSGGSTCETVGEISCRLLVNIMCH